MVTSNAKGNKNTSLVKPSEDNAAKIPVFNLFSGVDMKVVHARKPISNKLEITTQLIIDGVEHDVIEFSTQEAFSDYWKRITAAGIEPYKMFEEGWNLENYRVAERLEAQALKDAAGKVPTLDLPVLEVFTEIHIPGVAEAILVTEPVINDKVEQVSAVETVVAENKPVDVVMSDASVDASAPVVEEKEDLNALMASLN